MMNTHDSKTRVSENDKLDSDNIGKATDSDNVLKKESISSCEAEMLPELESHCPSNYASESLCTEEAEANNLKPQFSAGSDSRNLMVDVAGEGNSGITSCSNNICASSSVSANTLEGIESSSSNSTHVTLPISCSNTRYQEASEKSNYCKHVTPGLSSYICIGGDRDRDRAMEESVVGSALLGRAAKITQKAVDNVRARDSKNGLGIIADQNTMIGEKVGFNREASGSSSSPEAARNGETVVLSVIDSSDVNRETDPATKPEVASNSHNLLSGFDLNEDIQQNESVVETQSCYRMIKVRKPVPVMAKPGVPICLPQTTPLKIDGEVGWRGSSITSAFKPTSLSNRSTKASVFTGFDLNVAAGEDDSGNANEESSLEVGSNRAKGVNFDLNCLGDPDDNSQPASSSRDFDLNDHPSQPSVTDAYDQAARRVSGYPNFSHPTPGNWVGLSPMPGFNHGYPQPFLVAAPNVDPRGFPIHSPHVYCGNNGESSVILPYINDPRGHAVTPQMFGPAFSMATRPGGLGPGYITNIRPRFDLNNVVKSSDNRSTGGEYAGLSLFPINNSLTGDLSASSGKRKEPEGSWDSYHLRQTR